MKAPALIFALCSCWSVLAHADRFYVRGGVMYVDPNIAAHGLKIDAGALSALAMLGPIDGGVTASALAIPTAIVGYRFADRFAVETLVGIPMTIHLTAYGALATKPLASTVLGFIPTGIPPLGSDLGEASALAPVVSVIYRVGDIGPVTPIVGLGATVMVVTGVHVTNPVLTSVSPPEMDISPAVGGVLQAGLDIRVWHGWFARLDAKYLAFGDTEATISHIKVHTTIPFVGTVEIASAKLDVSATPLLVQAALGTSF